MSVFVNKLSGSLLYTRLRQSRTVGVLWSFSDLALPLTRFCVYWTRVIKPQVERWSLTSSPEATSESERLGRPVAGARTDRARTAISAQQGSGPSGGPEDIPGPARWRPCNSGCDRLECEHHRDLDQNGDTPTPLRRGGAWVAHVGSEPFVAPQPLRGNVRVSTCMLLPPALVGGAVNGSARANSRQGGRRALGRRSPTGVPD